MSLLLLIFSCFSFIHSSCFSGYEKSSVFKEEMQNFVGDQNLDNFSFNSSSSSTLLVS